MVAARGAVVVEEAVVAGRLERVLRRGRGSRRVPQDSSNRSNEGGHPGPKAKDVPPARSEASRGKVASRAKVGRSSGSLVNRGSRRVGGSLSSLVKEGSGRRTGVVKRRWNSLASPRCRW